ncbi:MAG: hypothetical protein JWO85_521 [Candidatus Eremiobacteraeota bacterium]|nr:hypothetical protein [Candidatus Eremiobacteraeota bacterium]
MTQDQLASLSGVPQTNISRHLRGETEPRLTHLDNYERALPDLRAIRARDAAERELDHAS